MPDQVHTSLGVRSEVRQEGTLRLSLKSALLPAPGPDEVLVEMAAAPLHPADIGLLLGPADLSRPTVSGSGECRSIVFPVPEGRMAALSTRMGRSLAVGNEGVGMVVDAGKHQRQLIGRGVALMGGGMITRFRVVPATDVLRIPDSVPLRAGAAVLINPLTALAMLETMREQGTPRWYTRRQPRRWVRCSTAPAFRTRSRS